MHVKVDMNASQLLKMLMLTQARLALLFAFVMHDRALTYRYQGCNL